MYLITLCALPLLLLLRYKKLALAGARDGGQRPTERPEPAMVMTE